MYRRLDPDRITETARKLSQRIAERFPDSGLRRISEELVSVCQSTARDVTWFARPHWPLRVAVGLLLGLVLAVFVATVVAIFRLPSGESMTSVIQAIDSGINEVVFLSAALYFLSTIEVRRKRKRALAEIHGLRSMAHIIDMHQLTKDPERLGAPASDNTPSSPARTLTPFLLSRYLDYCSEMLAILSKVAALYVQDFDDAVTLSAVNEVEDLTAGLSRKIWQKIVILDEDGGLAV